MGFNESVPTQWMSSKLKTTIDSKCNVTFAIVTKHDLILLPYTQIDNMIIAV